MIVSIGILLYMLLSKVRLEKVIEELIVQFWSRLLMTIWFNAIYMIVTTEIQLRVLEVILEIVIDIVEV